MIVASDCGCGGGNSVSARSPQLGGQTPQADRWVNGYGMATSLCRSPPLDLTRIFHTREPYRHCAGGRCQLAHFFPCVTAPASMTGMTFDDLNMMRVG